MKYLKINKLSAGLVGHPVLYKKSWDDEANRNGWKGTIVGVTNNRVLIDWTSTPKPNGPIKRQEYEASAILTNSHSSDSENYIFILDTTHNEVKINQCKIYDFKLDEATGFGDDVSSYKGFSCSMAWEDEEQLNLATIEYNVENSGKALLRLDSISCDYLDASDLASISGSINNLEKQIKLCDRWVIEEGDLIFMDTKKFGV